MPEQDILKWKERKNKKLLSSIMKEYSPIMHSEMSKYLVGNLPAQTVKSYAKRYLIDACKTFNPEKGAFTTHLVNNLKRLHRLNYDTSSTIRMSEELQRGVNVYKNAKEYLTGKLNREPSLVEVADHLGWSISKAGRTERNLKSEIISSTLAFDPSVAEIDDPRLDYIYHDLSPMDKKIFEHKMGYKGARVLPSGHIAKKLRISAPAVSVRTKKIAELIKKKLMLG